MVRTPPALPFVGTEKVGIEPRGLALAVTTGACLAAGYGGATSLAAERVFVDGVDVRDVPDSSH